jgi:hypothetical protein
MSIIPAFQRQRQEGCNFKVSLSYKKRTFLKKNLKIMFRNPTK